MLDEDSVARWLSQARGGDEDAVRRLWERYYRRLVDLASHRLPPNVRRDFDEEDVAVSAFHSLWRGIKGGRFPALDQDGLWPLLLLITTRKAQERLRRRRTLKRGGGELQGESALGADHAGDLGDINNVIGEGPSPEFAAELGDESERLLGLLEDPALRSIALLKLEGRSNDETADALACATRTVERRLVLIRRIWTEGT